MIIGAFILSSLLLFPGSAPENNTHPFFTSGEKLHYKGYVFGWLPVGDVWFEVKRDSLGEKEVYRFDARALGRYVVYTLDIRMSSFVDPLTLRSLKFHRRQMGSEKREYEVTYDREKLTGTYRKKSGNFHTVEELDAAPWKTDPPFTIHKDVNDILFTLYFAREIGDKIGNKKYYYFVEKDYTWKALVEITGERTIDLGRAGKFDALKIAITPDYSGQEEKWKKFRGLFGLEGSIEVWVDKKTRIPLIVKGSVPFAYVLRPTVSVVLQDYFIP